MTILSSRRECHTVRSGLRMVALMRCSDNLVLKKRVPHGQVRPHERSDLHQTVMETFCTECDSVINSTVSRRVDFWQCDFLHGMVCCCRVYRHGSGTLRTGEATSLLDMAPVHHKTSARHSRAICNANKIVVNRLFDRR